MRDAAFRVARFDQRTFSSGIPSNFESTFDVSTAIGKASIQDINANSGGISGGARTVDTVNPLLCFEAPYYSELRFTPAKVKPPFTSDYGFYSIPHQVQVTTQQSSEPTAQHAEVLVAGAEDFTPLFYTGPPVFYYEPLAPTS
jgi:hypothetical protein